MRYRVDLEVYLASALRIVEGVLECVSETLEVAINEASGSLVSGGSLDCGVAQKATQPGGLSRGATSDVSFSMDFVVQCGPVGWLMGAVMMKPMMRGITRDVLNGLAFHVTTGNTIGSEMPSAAALAAAVG